MPIRTLRIWDEPDINVITYKSKFGKYLVKSRGYKNMQLYKGTGLNVYIMYGISDNMSGVTNWIFYFQRCHDFFVFIWAQLLYRARLKNRKCFLFKWYNLIPPHMYLYSRTLCYRAIYSKACAHFYTESAHM